MITIEKVFDFDNSKVRIHIINDKEYFCASDVCKVLGYSNGRDAISKNCEPDGVASSDIIDSLGRNQKATFINEPNLYRLIIKSKLPKAQEFEKLVFEKILPEIRKTGAYSTPALPTSTLPTTINADFLLEVATKMKALEIENQQKAEIITEQTIEIENKERVINRYIGIEKEMPPSEAGKKLGLQPYKFIWKLKEMGYYTKADEPVQDYINRQYFVIKYSKPKMINGKEVKYPSFYITPKGFEHFFKKLQNGYFDDIKIQSKINKTY